MVKDQGTDLKWDDGILEYWLPARRAYTSERVLGLETIVVRSRVIEAKFKFDGS